MRPLYSYHDAIAPRILIEADGEFASDMLTFITKFELETDAAKSTQLKLVVANPQFRFTDDPRLLAGVRFKVCWGYPTDMSEVFTTTIMKAKPTFPDGGQMPTIELIAYDLRHEMTAGVEPKNWGTVSSSEVARQIAKRYGLGNDIEESGDARKKSRVQPANVNDFMFLQQLASKLNFACYLDNNILHFHPYRLGERPVMEFIYYNDNRGTIIDFVPEVNMNRPGQVKKTGATPTESKAVEAGPEAKPKAQLPEGRVVIDRFIPVTAYGNQDPKTKVIFAQEKKAAPIDYVNKMAVYSHESDKRVVAAEAAGAQQKMDMAASKASMKVIGTPRLKANQMIQVTGVGKAYSGNWYVVTAKHVIAPTGAAYITELKLSRTAANAKVTKPNEGDAESASASGKALRATDWKFNEAEAKIIRVENGTVRARYVGRGNAQPNPVNAKVSR